MNQITQSDINTSFEQEINLWKIIGNQTCSDILKVVAEQITTDGLEENTLIALIGKPNSGKRTFSLALNNTLCFEFKETLGDTLAFGGDDIFRYFKEGNEETTYFINNASNINRFAQTIIYRIIRQNKLRNNIPFEDKPEIIPIHNRLIILSSNNTDRIVQPLQNTIKMKCYLQDRLPQNDIFQILKQRCQYLGWELENEEIIYNIVAVAIDVSQALNILEFTYRLMKNNNDSIIKVDHLNRCLRLLNQNHQIKKITDELMV